MSIFSLHPQQQPSLHRKLHELPHRRPKPYVLVLPIRHTPHHPPPLHNNRITESLLLPIKIISHALTTDNRHPRAQLVDLVKNSHPFIFGGIEPGADLPLLACEKMQEMPSFGGLLGVVRSEEFVQIFDALFDVEDFAKVLLKKVDECFELFGGDKGFHGELCFWGGVG